MPGKMEAALAWAARGFSVFPCIAGTKQPRDAAFYDVATTDPVAIRNWWTRPVVGGEEEHNVGVSTTGLIVLDTDLKDGKPGLQSRASFGLSEWSTLTVRTPSGGYHEYFNGPSMGQAPPAPGLDVRSFHGYVLAPGSEIWADGAVVGRYDLVVDAPVLPCPPALLAVLKPPRARSDRAHNAVVETPGAVVAAEHFLAYVAPLAVEGMGGDITTFTVAAKMRGIGVSEETALRLMLSLWNERCSPPWPSDELAGKIANAYEYATNAPGDENPLADFLGVHLPEIQIAHERGVFEFGNAIPLMQLTPRPWLVKGLLLRQSVTLLVGAGGANKSTMQLMIAALLACGMDCFGYKTVEPKASIIFNAEDDRQEQSRRLHAICQIYGLDFDYVSARLMLLSSDDIDVRLAAGSPPQTNMVQVAKLVDLCRHKDIGMLALDPLVELHDVAEEDNVSMKHVLAIMRHIARAGDVTVLGAHHSRKPSTAGGLPAGDPNNARGASAIINSARIAKTLTEPTDADLKRFAIPENDRKKYVRLDDAKGNYSAASPSAVWFKRLGVLMPTGDDVVALQPTNMQAQLDGVALSVMRFFYQQLVDGNSSTIPLAEAATRLRSADPMYAKLAQNDVIERVAAMFNAGVRDEEHRGVIVQHEPKGRFLAVWA